MSSPSRNDQQYVGGVLGARVFLCFAAAYLVSYAFRSVNAVIAPALLADLGLSNADLGFLSSAYFVTFACLQLPLGIWLDRYGSRRTEAVLLLFAVVGAAVFASASSLIGLWVGRALIGVGVSGCLMAAFTAFRRWYAPVRQPQLNSWMLFAGTAGALSSTVPVNLALPLIGWRGVFWVMAALILLVAVAIWFVMKPAEQMVPLQPKAKGDPGGYATLFRDRYFQRLCLLGSVCQGSFIAMQTLWVGPWLVTVQGMDPHRSSEVLFAFNLSLMCGYLALSWWGPRLVGQGTRRGWPVTTVLTVGMSCTLLTQAAILLFKGDGAWLLWLVLALFAPTITLAQTQVAMTFPASLVGRANSAYNMTVFVFAFCVQWGLGLVIDAFRHAGLAGPEAMRAALAVSLGIQIAGVIVFAMHPSRNHALAVSS
jgi:predicted MFS family arabinose efflux permease